MKDILHIKETEKGFEITRTLWEAVNENDLKERLNALRQQEEIAVDELDRIRRNIKITEDALATGEGQTTL